MSAAKKKIRKNVRKRKPDRLVNMRGCLTMLAEFCCIAGFLLALYIFIKEYL